MTSLRFASQLEETDVAYQYGRPEASDKEPNAFAKQ